MTRKKIILLLAVLLLLLFVFLSIPKCGNEEVSRLTEELEKKTDSLECLNQKYDSLFTEYGKVESSLVQMKGHLKDYRSAVDSLSKCRITNVDGVMSVLHSLLEEKDSLPVIIKKENNFRF